MIFVQPGRRLLGGGGRRCRRCADVYKRQPLESHSLLGVRYVADIRALGLPDFVLLPGTKNTMDDLLWLRQSGMEAALLRLHGAGVPILGVCGGYQMLGETVEDVYKRQGLGGVPWDNF